ENTPCGPSTYTVVPGSSALTVEVKSPSALIATSTLVRSALDEKENGCWVSENGERPNANHANCPGWKLKPFPVGGVSATVVVWPRSSTMRATRHGRDRARRGLTIRTHTSRPANAADMRPQRSCFHSELTYSSTNKTCPSAPTINTTASTLCVTCQTSYDRRSRLRHRDVATSTTSANSAAIPNHTNSGAASACETVTSFHL